MTKKVSFKRLKNAFHKYTNKTKRKNKTGCTFAYVGTTFFEL